MKTTSTTTEPTYYGEGMSYGDEVITYTQLLQLAEETTSRRDAIYYIKEADKMRMNGLTFSQQGF